MQDAQPNTTRTRIEDWFVELYPQLKDLAYEVHPGLLVWDADTILNELAEKVPTCRCKSRDSFLRWARKFVRRRVQQIRDTEALLTEFRKPILAAIYRANSSWVRDESIEMDDLFSEVAAGIYAEVDDLKKEGTAKPSTRLYGLAREHVLRYHTMPRKRRHALTAAHIAQGGEIVGAYSEAELAELKSQANEKKWSVMAA